MSAEIVHIGDTQLGMQLRASILTNDPKWVELSAKAAAYSDMGHSTLGLIYRKQAKLRAAEVLFGSEAW